MRRAERLDNLLTAAAFLAATARSWGLTAPADASYHLVRVGNALWSGRLDAYASPPGGTSATLLGSAVTSAGAWFAAGVEDLGRPAGAVLLGACAAVLARTVALAANRLVALLAVALLVAPPAIASAFPARPDAALAGWLLVAAFGYRLLDERPTRAVSLAWVASLAAPAAVPVALWMQLSMRREHRAAPRNWIAAAAVSAVVTALSLALPAGDRLEILRGTFSDWSLSPAGWRSTGQALAHVWGFGLLLAAPLLLVLFPEARARRLVGPWAACIVTSAVLSRPEMFRESAAAYAPITCLLLACAAHALPEKSGAGPPRSVLAAFAVPAAFLLLGAREAGEWRGELRREAARDAQVAEFLEERLGGTGSVLATRSGYLASIKDRRVHALRGTLPNPGDDAPAVVVFRKAIRPDAPDERKLFARPSFLSRYAPLLFRRGPTRGIQDAVWVLRSDPVTIDTWSPDYAELLRMGWARHANGDRVGALRSFRAAVPLEPAGLGIAREWAGMMFEESVTEPRAAEVFFVEARTRDATTVRARGHLADRALSQNRLGEADSLIAEAFEFTEQDAELWGLRARLMQLAGDPVGALKESETAVRMNPRDGRMLANHGVLLWETGDHGGAREFWRLAVRWDSRILRYLGDFENAPDDAPAPPMLPLFTLEGFAPPLAQRPGGSPPP